MTVHATHAQPERVETLWYCTGCGRIHPLEPVGEPEPLPDGLLEALDVGHYSSIDERYAIVVCGDGQRRPAIRDAKRARHLAFSLCERSLPSDPLLAKTYGADYAQNPDKRKMLR